MAMRWTVKVRPDVWVDPRTKYLSKLVGCEYRAIGKLVEFWGEAQSYWVNGNPMPTDIFRLLDSDSLIKAGFAEEVEGGVRAKGDHEHFSWLTSQRDRGAKSAETRRAKYGTAQPGKNKSFSTSDRAQVEDRSNGGSGELRTAPNHELEQELEQEQEHKEKKNEDCDCVTALALAVDSDAKKFLLSESEIPVTDAEMTVDFQGEKSMPLSQTETSRDSTESPSQVSRACFDTKSTDSHDVGIKIETPDSNKIQLSPKKRKRPDVSPEDAAARSATRSAYIDAFESRYAAKPIIAAKENTQIKNLVASVGQQDAPYLVKFYLECSDDFLVNKCHPIGILAANPTEYIVRMKKGQTHRDRPNLFQKKPPEDKPSAELIERLTRKYAK